MWNRAISSKYTHAISAIVLTAGFVIAFLAGYPKKASVGQFDISAHGSASTEVLDSSADPNYAARLPEQQYFDYSFVYPDTPDDRQR